MRARGRPAVGPASSGRAQSIFPAAGGAAGTDWWLLTAGYIALWGLLPSSNREESEAPGG